MTASVARSVRFVRHCMLCALACFLVAALGSSAVAASFDCRQASSPVEKLICGNDAVSALDTRLSQIYGELRDSLGQAEAENLRRDQTQWLKRRDRCGDTGCLTSRYQERIDALDRVLVANQYAGQPMEVTSVLEQTYDNGASLVVRFTVPVDSAKDFRRYLEVERDNALEPRENWLLSEDGLLAIYPFVEPQTKYLVRVKPGIAAINGATHAGNRSFTISTRRSEPSAAFAGSGHVMSAQLKRALPVTTLDVDEVDLDIFRIAPEAIPQWSSFSNSQQRNTYQLKNFTTANPLVHSGRFPISHKRHQRTTTNLDLSTIAALDQQGAYLAVLRIPGQYSYQYDTHFFTVSDIGLQVRKNTEAMHVICHSIVSGDPLEQIEVSLYKGKELRAQQQTAANGIATFDNWFDDATTVIARQKEQITVLRLDRPLDLSGIRNAVSHHQETQLFAWGPRDLYRPGETLETYAILRDFDGRNLRPHPIKIELVDAAGSQVHTATLNARKEGVYAFTFTLADSAKTGRWKLLYRAPGDKTILHEYSFSVEDFLPERMRLTLFDGDASKRRLQPYGGSFDIPVAGAYLYGAPAAGNKVDGVILAELDRHPFDQWSTYFFGIDGEKINERQRQLPEFSLDEAGTGAWKVDSTHWSDVTSPLALTTTASLYESGGRPVTRSISVTQIQQKTLVGIEPQFKDDPENNSRPGFKLILTDRAGEMQPGKGYQLVLIREDRNYYWTFSDSEGWEWHYDPMEYEVYSKKLQFDGRQPVTAAMPVKWGNYRLEARDANNTLVSSFRFRTGWYWWGNAETGAALKPDQVRMTFRDKVYHQGDTARLLLTPPTDGLATITVETGDEILWVRQQPVTSKGTEIALPIDNDWHRHDIYVTATVLTPGDMTQTVAPKRAFGFINLPLQRQDATLAVTLAVPERVQPRQQAKATVTVSSPQGVPAHTYVTLAAVDVGVLNITRFATPDPAAYLYGPRRYDATYYDIYGRIIENAGFKNSRQRFGGGFAASAAELARGGNKPKSDVQIVAWQSKPVPVGADGTAQIALDVPEFNGKLRWMAIVYSDQAYGKADAETLVADKVVVQLAKPRFMALGDGAQLSLDLSNQSGGPLQLEVALATAGGFAAHSWQKTVSLDDTKKTTLRFPVQATQHGQGDIHLQVNSTPSTADAIALKRDWFVGLRSAYPAVTRKERQVIDPGASWSPRLETADLDPASIQAQLVLSSQPPIDANSHFDQLLHYPYGCTEQSTSSGYPWVLVEPELARSMGLLPSIQRSFHQDYTDSFRKEQINKAITRVLRNQNSNGGFGIWSSAAEEMNWLTAYVTDFLTDAQYAGGDVPGTALEKAVNRLESYVKGNGRIDHPWGRDAGYYAFATRAYAAYVLAKINRLNLSDLRRFYQEVKGKHTQSGLPWVQLGFAFDTLGDSSRAQEAYDTAHGISYVENYYGTYDSELRDLALSFAILAKRGRGQGEMLLKIFELAKDRRWLSTQERNALFKAAVAANTTFGDQPLVATIQTTGHQQRLHQDQTFKTLLTGDQLASIEAITSGKDTVYGSLELIGEYAKPPAPYGRGLTIARDYYDLKGQPLALSTVKSGDLVIVRLTVSAQQWTPDGLVVDLLPAGLELENQNLSNSSVDLSKLQIDGKDVRGWQQKAQVQHVEYRDDRFIAALALDDYGHDRVLYYLARAVTPGRYLVPPPYIEDMYRPYYQAVGATPTALTVKP